MKVVKAYSIDIETAKLLERYHKDAYGQIGSRSKTVCDAIRWYIGGEEDSIASLRARCDKYWEGIQWREAKIEELEERLRTGLVYNTDQDQRPWWKIILGIKK